MFTSKTADLKKNIYIFVFFKINDFLIFILYTNVVG